MHDRVKNIVARSARNGVYINRVGGNSIRKRRDVLVVYLIRGCRAVSTNREKRPTEATESVNGREIFPSFRTVTPFTTRFRRDAVDASTIGDVRIQLLSRRMFPASDVDVSRNPVGGWVASYVRLGTRDPFPGEFATVTPPVISRD